jgi:alpha-tubulin suppressor-like RCC1 family protein
MAIFAIGTTLSWYQGVVEAGITTLTPLAKGFSQIASGNDFSCGIANGTGKVYCWGNGQYGRLGNGSTSPQAYPTPVDMTGVLAGKTAISIDAGYNMACIIASDNNGYCWGGNGSGELGNGATTDSSVPVAVSTGPTSALNGKTLKKISVGHVHTCAIASDDLAYCWGNNIAGQLGNNTTTSSSVPVAVDTGATSGLNGKTVLDITSTNFGNILFWQYHSHTCAVASDNKAYCWGRNNNGQLGDGTTTSRSVPVAVDTSVASALNGKTVTSISGGYYNTCAIASGSAYCWGAGTRGALGNGGTANSSYPVAVKADTGVLLGKTLTSISSSGNNHSCAIDTAGQAYCWGTGTLGQLGDNLSANSSVPVAVDTSGWLSGKTIKSISANGQSTTLAHTCAVTTDGGGYCWGSNSTGQLGTKIVSSGSGQKSQTPVPIFADNDPFSTSAWRAFANTNSITPGTPLASTNTVPTVNGTDTFRLRAGLKSTALMADVKSGNNFSCGLTQTNEVYCWGLNANGQLGNNSTVSSADPVAVNTAGALNDKTIKALSVGDAHACVIASDNNVYCWGSNASGQLGDNQVCGTGNCLVPVAVNTTGVLSGKTVTAISAGGLHTCAIASDNLAYCWGDNTSGQLGDNSTTQRNIPVAVDANTGSALNAKTVQSISASLYHTCAIASDNLAHCWGGNNSGALGNNSTTQSNIPVMVDVGASSALSGKLVVAVFTGKFYSTCAIASDNLAYCWGDNTSGQLGNGNTTSSSLPVAVDTGVSSALNGKTVKSISLGSYFACAIASDNLPYCWGIGSSGQMGNGTTAATNSLPKAVTASGQLSGKAVVSVSTGLNHACSVASDNKSYCWGSNTNGQLGVSTATVNPSLVPYASNMNTMAGPQINASDNSYKLQFATRSAATCAAQITGFTDITSSTTVAFNDNTSVANNTIISSTANDPVPAADVSLQSYVDASGLFTNPNNIPSGKTGLWDFSLKTISATGATSYCVRMVYSDGMPIEQSMYFPEITIAGSTPTLSLSFVDSGGAGITNPTFNFGSAFSSGTFQTTTSTFGDSTRRLRLSNTTYANGWNVTIAPTDGPTANWNRSDSLAKYDLNDSGANGTDSAVDTDLLGGQLSLNPALATITPQASCSTTGIAKGSNSSFVEGTVNNIMLLSATSASQQNCYWDFYGAGISQTIPASQPAGMYTISLTATAVSL